METTRSKLRFSLLDTSVTILTLLSLTCSPALADHWTITDLGALGAEGSLAYTSEGLNINNSGQVAGKGVVLNNGVRENHFVLWSNGTQIDLGIEASSSLVDVAPINDAGQVAGWIAAENDRPFLWQAGVVTRLPWLTSVTNGGGVAGINASGTVVGYNGVQRWWGVERVSVRWQGGTVTDLGLPWGKVTAINDSGALAISVDMMGQRSYVLTGGSSNVVELPGLDPLRGTTAALDLNNASQVCGWFILNPDVSSELHALFWQGSVGTPLPEFHGGGSSTAVALNNLGHAVGSAVRAANDRPAVLWRDGTLTSLNDLPEVVAAGWSALEAHDINDHDQIVGHGYRDGLVRAFLLTPGSMPLPFSVTHTRNRTNLVVSFPTEDSIAYHVEFKRGLADTNWSLLTTISGNGSPQSFTNPMTNTAQFFRVIVP